VSSVTSNAGTNGVSGTVLMSVGTSSNADIESVTVLSGAGTVITASVRSADNWNNGAISIESTADTNVTGVEVSINTGASSAGVGRDMNLNTGASDSNNGGNLNTTIAGDDNVASMTKKRIISQNEYTESDSDDSSIAATRGLWDGDDVPWLGCVCGKIHSRPAIVFWIQCDGPCRSWYNVSVDCVGFDKKDADMLISWSCWDCSKQISPQLHLLLSLPVVLLYKICTFVAHPMDRAAILSLQIAKLCRMTRYMVYHSSNWNELWSLILREYQRDGISSSSSSSSSSPSRIMRIGGGGCGKLRNSPRRTSKRHNSMVRVAREEVREAHLLVCGRTDDVHMELVKMGESNTTPLTLKRLRQILSSADGQLIRVNRRSQFGRTFLVECCAVDYSREGDILRCIKELVEKYGADPNIYTNDEYPYADRPVLYFAISRLMPRIVQYLVYNAGACLDVKVTGCFRLVSNISTMFYGTYSPLSFAKALKAAESPGSLSPNLSNKLEQCIQILSKAERQSSPDLRPRSEREIGKDDFC